MKIKRAFLLPVFIFHKPKIKSTYQQQVKSHSLDSSSRSCRDFSPRSWSRDCSSHWILFSFSSNYFPSYSTTLTVPYWLSWHTHHENLWLYSRYQWVRTHRVYFSWEFLVFAFGRFPLYPTTNLSAFRYGFYLLNRNLGQVNERNSSCSWKRKFIEWFVRWCTTVELSIDIQILPIH